MICRCRQLKPGVNSTIECCSLIRRKNHVKGRILCLMYTWIYTNYTFTELGLVRLIAQNSHALLLSTSGAIYKGDPNMLSASDPWGRCRASPKSAIWGRDFCGVEIKHYRCSSAPSLHWTEPTKKRSWTCGIESCMHMLQ